MSLKFPTFWPLLLLYWFFLIFPELTFWPVNPLPHSFISLIWFSMYYYFFWSKLYYYVALVVPIQFLSGKIGFHNLCDNLVMILVWTHGIIVENDGKEYDPRITLTRSLFEWKILCESFFFLYFVVFFFF